MERCSFGPCVLLLFLSGPSFCVPVASLTSDSDPPSVSAANGIVSIGANPTLATDRVSRSLHSSACPALSSSSVSTAALQETMPPTAANEDSDNLQPWKDRWESDRIGFHLDDVNPVILKHWNSQIVESLTTAKTQRSNSVPIQCLVPLCGKTVDMAYIVAKSTSPVHVHGVDGIRKSLQDFAKEQPQLEIAEQTGTDKFERFGGTAITLWKGDFFDFSVDSARFDAVFDRGSLVAIDPAMRDTYLRVISDVVAPGGRVLLVTLERRSQSNVEATKKGPPFSIAESDVRKLYEPLEWVESVTLIESTNTFETTPSSRERYAELDSMWEHTFVIQAKKRT